MRVLAVVGLRKMLMPRQVGFLVIDRSKKMTLLDSRVGLLDVAVDSVNVLQYVIRDGARGVVDKQHIIHVPGVKGQDLGVNEVLNDEFLKVL
jgi:hypothetical protein